jgi:hypothetical protein
MAEPITLGNSANKWVKDANTLGLTYSDIYTASGTVTVYTCPVGKVATVVSVGLSASSDQYYTKGRILANGSAIASITAAAGNEGNSNSFSMSVYARITAGQTVAFEAVDVHASSIIGLSAFLVETDP